jgi:hypothetical protein
MTWSTKEDDMGDDSPTARRFEAALLEAYEAWKREADYVARQFKPMVRRHGGVETARRLLRKPGVSTGFARLADSGKLDLTLEYVVLQPDFAPLFTFEERQIARQRLVDHGMAADRLP